MISSDFDSDSTDFTNLVVTRVKKFKIVKRDWVRLVGVKCDIIYEINVLEFKRWQLDHRIEVRERDLTPDSTLFHLIERWNVGQRTIFRTYREILSFFQDILELVPFGLEGNKALLQIVTAMERLDFSQILRVKDELEKSCVYIDNALRLITSDVDLCRNSTYVKLFLCMKLNHEIVPRWKIGDTSNCLRIPCGQSVDSFIKLWVLEVEDPKLLAKNIHWTNFVMLLMQKPIVESIVSISPLLAVAIHKLNMRAEMFVIFCGGFFCGSYINGVIEKANAVRKYENHYSRCENFLYAMDDFEQGGIGAFHSNKDLIDSYREEKEKHHEKFNRGQQYNFTPKPHREKNDVDNDLINYEDSANTLVHNPTIAPIGKCGDLGNTFSEKSTRENSEFKVDGIGQSQEDNCDHSSCTNVIEDLPSLTSDDEKYLSYVPSDDEVERSLRNAKPVAESRNLECMLTHGHRKKKKKKIGTKKRVQKHKRA